MSSGRRIYHITHGRNLAGVLREQRLWSDIRTRDTDLAVTNIGMQRVKDQRRTKPVPCHPGTRLGEYVPFNFCARSVMLYVLHRGNHEKLTYSEGQRPLLHLSAPVEDVISWLEQTGRRWAFTDANAAAAYARFDDDPDGIDGLPWEQIASRDFTDTATRSAKQAEFLVHTSLPFELIDQIGVINRSVQRRVRQLLADSPHQPTVHVRRHWYY